MRQVSVPEMNKIITGREDRASNEKQRVPLLLQLCVCVLFELGEVDVSGQRGDERVPRNGRHVGLSNVPPRSVRFATETLCMLAPAHFISFEKCSLRHVGNVRFATSVVWKFFRRKKA